MATEVAHAYVTLMPEMRGFQSALNKNLSGMSFNVGSTKKLSSSLAAGLTKGLKVVTGAIAGIGGAVSGLIATGGIARALNIEQAQYMLKQMGMDVQTVMDNANTAVKGTAFGLDEAAKAAALFGSAGVNAGEEMARTLQMTAGIAAMSGSGMMDIADILTTVAAKGRVTSVELNRLTQRGINATAALAKSLNKTQAEIKDMVSKGQIDFQTFTDAMYETFGQAAYGANDTFQGALANTRAALSRLGAKFATPGLDSLKNILQVLMKSIDAVSGLLDPLVARFKGLTETITGRVVAGLEQFLHELESGISITEALDDALEVTFGAGVYSSIKSVATALGLAATGAGGLLAAFKGLEVVRTLSTVFGGLTAKFGKFKKDTGESTTIVKMFRSSLVDATKKAIPQAAQKILELGQSGEFTGEQVRLATMKLKSLEQTLMGIGSGTIVGQLNKVKGAFAPLAQAMVPVVERAQKLNSKMKQLAKTASQRLAKGLAKATAALGAMAVGFLGAAAAAVVAGVDVEAKAAELITNIHSFTNNLPAVLQQVVAVLPAIVATISESMPLVADAVLQGVLGVVELLPDILPALIDSISSVIGIIVEQLPTLLRAVGEALIGCLPLILEGGLQMFMGLVMALIDILPDLIAELPNIITRVCDTLIDFIPELLTAAQTLFTALIQALPIILPALLTAIGQVLLDLFKKIRESWPQMKEAAVNMMKGIVEGIKQAIPACLSAIGDACSALWNKAKSYFKIGSPSKLMRDTFRWVGEGMALGLEDERENIVGTMESISAETARAAAFDASASASRYASSAASSYTPASQGSVVYDFGGITLEARELADMQTVEDFIKRLERQAIRKERMA